MSIMVGFAGSGASRVTLNYVISANTAEAIVDAATINGYYPGQTDLVITVNNGIYVYSNNTANPALTIQGLTGQDTAR